MLVPLAEADIVVLEVAQAQAQQTGQMTFQMVVPVPLLRKIVFQRLLHKDSIVGRKLPIGFAVVVAVDTVGPGAAAAAAAAAEDNP